ncbi:MAG: hypothetical protein L0241_08390, partial [Planctomycetia bacterium]|nr:hypothetical protein [Planctomycetia bacterium]
KLAKVTELHGVVRQWLVDTATAQRNEHIKANLPYADLMFSLGLALLGDSASAKKLLEDARKVMEGPIPEGGSPQADQALCAAVVCNFMFKAFKYRIEQAIDRKPHTGPMSAELVADLEQIKTKGGSGPVNNPYKLAHFIIDKFRNQSRIVEPYEAPDPYAAWTKPGDPLKDALAELRLIREPATLAERIRPLYRKGLPGKNLPEVQFFVLHECLLLSPRVGEAFTLEMIGLVPAALGVGTGGANEPPDLPRKQGELLQRALVLAGLYNRDDLVKKLVDDFTTLVRARPEEVRFRLINAVAGQTLRVLRKLGLVANIDLLLNSLRNEVLQGATLAEMKRKHAVRPEKWGTGLRALLSLAAGWLMLGRNDQAEPILAQAGNELLKPSGAWLQPMDYTDLARAYVVALGEGPAETGLNRITELFREMPRTKITNTWTTAQYYSRFHLLLVEDTVATVCQAPPEPKPHVVG